MNNLKTTKLNKIIDKVVSNIYLLMTLISASFMLIIIIFILFKGLSPFMSNYQYGVVNFLDFLFGTQYRPDMGIYGVGFIIINTLVSALLALSIAFPISVLTALFVVKIAPQRLSEFMKVVIDLLASIPSIVYGVFAAGIITKFTMTIASMLGVQTYGGTSLLSVVILLAIMIFPTITSISISSISSVSEDLQHASLALGATKVQTNFKVVLLSAKQGIFAGAILGVGRAFGEATAVSMVAGNKMFGPTFGLFNTTRTLTSTMIAGLKETSGLDYDIRFSIGLVLLIIILITNFGLNFIKNKVGKTHEKN